MHGEYGKRRARRHVPASGRAARARRTLRLPADAPPDHRPADDAAGRRVGRREGLLDEPEPAASPGVPCLRDGVLAPHRFFLRRDAKGWTPLAVAIFCDQKKCAEMLLKHGADPTIANSFGHTAYDLSKDQVAGDERTILKDKSEVRAVLEEYDAERRAERRRPSKDAAPAEPLPPEGTAVAMQLEVVEDAKAREEASESTAKVAVVAKLKAKAKKKKKKGGAGAKKKK